MRRVGWTTTRRRPRRLAIGCLLTAALVAGCGQGSTVAAPGPDDGSAEVVHATDHGGGPGGGHDGHSLRQADRVAAQLAAAAFQDVSQAEAVGYESTLDALGCFQDPQRGGMGVHYLNDDLMDAELDIAHPEALVYELDAEGRIAGLVAHEYIVPTDAWTKSIPPTVADIALHRHPTLPLWVLHTWLWKNNPAGLLDDWNPAVRLCPPEVPIFGVDRPEATGVTAPPADAVGGGPPRGPLS